MKLRSSRIIVLIKGRGGAIPMSPFRDVVLEAWTLVPDAVLELDIGEGMKYCEGVVTTKASRSENIASPRESRY
jgi:hypothetical protein